MRRRRFLKSVAGSAVAAASIHRSAAVPPKRFPIGVCDWTLRKTADPAALDVAKRCGIDGVMVDFGRPDQDKPDTLPLFAKDHRKAYAEKVKATDVAISSLAMGVLNQVPLKDPADPRPGRWVRDSVDVAVAMKRKVVLLAFFGKGDLRDDPKGTDVVVKHLKKLMPRAEDAGIVYGIESWLQIDPVTEILERVGSPNLQVYYDVGNLKKVGADVYSEIEKLGRKRICEVHAKDYKGLYGKGDIDFPRLRKTLERIDYNSWIVMEGTDMSLGVEESNRFDADYLRGVFK